LVGVAKAGRDTQGAGNRKPNFVVFIAAAGLMHPDAAIVSALIFEAHRLKIRQRIKFGDFNYLRLKDLFALLVS
jgi:hypothetical protein